METATQALHRLTSYDPGREWTEPPDDPRAVRSFEPNDLERLPWFYKHYAQPLPRVPLPRELPSTDAPAVAVLAGTAEVPGAALDLSHLEALCKERMPAYMVPWRIEVCDGSLPRNANGKIDRKSIGDAWRQTAAAVIET